MSRFSLIVRVVGCLMVLAPVAAAYSFDLCNGSSVKLSGSASYYRNTHSIPTGTDKASAYFNAINRWNDVRAMADRLVAHGTTSGSSITHGDDRFDAAVVARSAIGGLSGLTKKFYNVACVPFVTKKIIEADVMVASDIPFGNPAEDVLLDNGRDVFMHEFGHALGLQHYQSFNIMRSASPRPHFGGPGEHIDVLPDDAAGGRALYPVSGTHTNVLSSAYRRDTSNDTILLNQTPGTTVFACSGGGGVLGVQATVANNGNVNVTQTERWFMSTNSTAYGGTQVFQWNNSTYNANSALTILRTFTLPALSVGTYRLFHSVDALNQHAEVREDDNSAREVLIIEVISC